MSIIFSYFCFGSGSVKQHEFVNSINFAWNIWQMPIVQENSDINYVYYF